MAITKVTANVLADNSVSAAKIANDAVGFEKVDAEFTTSRALRAGATVNVD